MHHIHKHSDLKTILLHMLCPGDFVVIEYCYVKSISQANTHHVIQSLAKTHMGCLTHNNDQSCLKSHKLNHFKQK